jgi:amidase
MNSPTTSSLPFEDTVGAWVPHGRFTVEPTSDGPLSGLSFAAKDLFDVAGHRTGAGNPTWLDTHAPASAHSALVAQLLGAGATLHGKTITDELAYSIHGDNLHYGAPLNTRAPDRVTGGSSSGSAAAAAAGLVDFALGTDTGGSTRVPGSYCGLWSLRTTQGLLSTEGVVPLSPLFDTMTWLAADAEVFERVGQTLLAGANEHAWRGAVVLTDACAQAEPLFMPLIDRVTETISTQFSLPVSYASTSDTDLEAWRQTYITVSAYDAWQTHKDWITSARPTFANAIQGRWQAAANISIETVEQARSLEFALKAQVRSLLGADRIAILPSASSPAIARNADAATVDAIRASTFRITSIAGLAGLPQINIPFIAQNGLPAGVSLLGPAGSDLALIRLAVAVGKNVNALGSGHG